MVTSVISALGKGWPGDEEFKFILGYTVSLKPTTYV